jgi:phosphatidylinositol glycan class N
MTDHGSHGAGEDDETLTPFVLWGSGVMPIPFQQVINQIDLTPLQSALLNIPIPTNNLGILPLNFLNVPSMYRFQSSCANLKQVLKIPVI